MPKIDILSRFTIIGELQPELLSNNNSRTMNNNDVMKKLRVALSLRDDDIVAILKLVDFNISKSELSAFFRKEGHPNYRECGDQVLRNFLNGLVLHLRGPKPDKKSGSPKPVSEKFKAKPLKKPGQN